MSYYVTILAPSVNMETPVGGNLDWVSAVRLACSQVRNVLGEDYIVDITEENSRKVLRSYDCVTGDLTVQEM